MVSGFTTLFDYQCRWQHKGKKKKQTDKEDLYALLGLANERWTANDNQIKLGQSRYQTPSCPACSLA